MSAPDQAGVRAAAHDAVDYGWRVIPIARGTKIPAASFGLHHTIGDHDTVEHAWTRHPSAQLAVACARSGLVVIEADERHGADLRALALAGDLPPTRVVRSPGGVHWYFLDASVELRGTLPGLVGYEVKRNGYVLAPPSLHPSGDRYILLHDDEIAPLPDWILALARRPEHSPPSIGVHAAPLDARERAYVETAIRNEVDALASARPGARNNALARAAFVVGQFVASGAVDHNRAVALLETACAMNRLSCDEPRRTAATLHRQLAVGMQHPRRVPHPALGDARMLLEALAASPSPCEVADVIADTPDALRALADAPPAELRTEWIAAYDTLARCGGHRDADDFLALVITEREARRERRRSSK